MHTWVFRLFLLSFLLISLLQKAQEQSDFNLLLDKAVQKTYQNPDDGISFSQTILLNDKKNEHQLLLQHLISQAYYLKGDYLQSVKTSLGTTKSDAKEESAFSQLFLNYSLAEQYQNLGLYNQSQKIIDQTLLINLEKKVNNSEHNITISKLYQLKAINYGVLKKYKDLEENLKESNRYLNQSDHENRIIGLENKIFLANALLQQNKSVEAKKMVEETLVQIEKYPEYHFHFTLAKIALAQIYFRERNYSDAILSLNTGLARIKNLGYLPLESKINEELSKNYFALKDIKTSQKFNEIHAEIQSKLDDQQKDGISYIVKLVENYESKNLEYFTEQEQSKSKTSLFIIVSTLLLLLGFLLFQNDKGKKLKKQLAFLNHFTETKRPEIIEQKSLEIENSTSVSENNLENVDQKNSKKSASISKMKELEILQKLDELERSERFLSKNMSLATLAGQCGTSTKYLSEVINNNKGKNYNAYINELRINHIAYLLKTNPVYLTYKVSYLAEISGFSSHSSFATVFKSVTGMTPNTYIQQVNTSKS